ncbi:MAG: hypothetical protein OJF49_004731 [Ktedonobacterales bacterium]|nr:MAG: hypothetical protein OJF49_004731 [Ktedonobacterales bacterium]
MSGEVLAARVVILVAEMIYTEIAMTSPALAASFKFALGAGWDRTYTWV